MPSKVGLANDALRLLGAKRITAFDAGTKNANIVNDIYDDVRQEMLQFPWNFATARAKLAQLTSTPAFGFDHAYALPSDWIYTISAHNNDRGSGTILFKEELLDSQNVLMSDADDVYIRYTMDLEDPNLMSAKFRRAFVTTLARDMCIAITNSNTLQDQLMKSAKKLLLAARSSDGIQSSPERRPRGSWVNSRGGRRPNGNDMNFNL